MSIKKDILRPSGIALKRNNKSCLSTPKIHYDPICSPNIPKHKSQKKIKLKIKDSSLDKSCRSDSKRDKINSDDSSFKSGEGGRTKSNTGNNIL